MSKAREAYGSKTKYALLRKAGDLVGKLMGVELTLYPQSLSRKGYNAYANKEGYLLLRSGDYPTYGLLYLRYKTATGLLQPPFSSKYGSHTILFDDKVTSLLHVNTETLRTIISEERRHIKTHKDSFGNSFKRMPMELLLGEDGVNAYGCIASLDVPDVSVTRGTTLEFEDEDDLEEDDESQ